MEDRLTRVLDKDNKSRIEKFMFGFSKENHDEEKLHQELMEHQKRVFEIMELLDSKTSTRKFEINENAIGGLAYTYPFFRSLDYNPSNETLEITCEHMPLAIAASRLDAEPGRGDWHNWSMYMSKPLYSFTTKIKRMSNNSPISNASIYNTSPFISNIPKYLEDEGFPNLNYTRVGRSIEATHPHCCDRRNPFSLDSICVGSHEFRNMIRQGIEDASKLHHMISDLLSWLNTAHLLDWHGKNITPAYELRSYYSFGRAKAENKELMGNTFVAIRKETHRVLEYCQTGTSYDSSMLDSLREKLSSIRGDLLGVASVGSEDHARYLEPFSLENQVTGVLHLLQEVDTRSLNNGNELLRKMLALYQHAYSALLLTYWQGNDSGRRATMPVYMDHGLVRNLLIQDLLPPNHAYSLLNLKKMNLKNYKRDPNNGNERPKSGLNCMLAAPAMLRKYAAHFGTELKWMTDYLPDPETEIEKCEKYELNHI